MNKKIGVFICHCGGNIGDYVDVDRVCETIAGEDGVAVAKTHVFTCSDAAQQEMIEDMRTEELDGLVIASCSPKLHMFTFRKMAERAGLNPYQYVHVNLREQCSWAHTDDQAGATAKAVHLVRGGVAKCLRTRALEPTRIETTPSVLVIGAGAAGLRAALASADLGLTVHVVEQADEPGGWARQWDRTFPADRSGRELIAGLVEQVRARENITLYTSAELVEKQGSVGDFQVTISAGEGERITLDVGAIIVASGFEPYQPAEGEFGYGDPAVVTLGDFKQMLADSAGPLTHNGRPVRTVAYVYCVGSRQGRDVENPNAYCSRYCCSAATHAAVCASELDGRINQYHLFRDMRTYGKAEVIYERAGEQGSVFLRYAAGDPPRVSRDGDVLAVELKDQLLGGEEVRIDADLVVLVAGMVPRADGRLAEVLKTPIGKDGFFNEIHLKLRPVETVIDGVFLAGTCQGPKTLAESVASSLAAVAKAGALLMKGYVDLEPLIAKVDADRCTGCGDCLAACPYGAIEIVADGDTNVARVSESLCKGEGGCVPVCPHGAIDVEGYTDQQVRAMIAALARETA